MENIKHKRQAITDEMIEDFMSKYTLATKEDIITWIENQIKTNGDILEEILGVITDGNL